MLHLHLSIVNAFMVTIKWQLFYFPKEPHHFMITQTFKLAYFASFSGSHSVLNTLGVE